MYNLNTERSNMDIGIQEQHYYCGCTSINYVIIELGSNIIILYDVFLFICMQCLLVVAAFRYYLCIIILLHY